MFALPLHCARLIWTTWLLIALMGGHLTAGAQGILVKNALLITQKPGQDAAFLGYLRAGADGRITAVGAGDAPAPLEGERVVDAAGKIVAPGFISAHSHLFTSPLRGLGHTETLYGWGAAVGRLNNLTTADDLYWFTLHGSLDFLRNGITTAYDFTYSGAVGGAAVGVGEKVPPPSLKPGPFEENQMRAKADAGLRFINSVGLPRVGGRAAMLARLEGLLAHARTTYAQQPLFLGMAISGGLQRAPTRETAELEAYVMKTYHLINQSHFLESPERVEEQQAKFSWYVDAGALSPQFIFGHFIQTNPDLVRQAAAAGASMSWQPTSNSRLASGVADIVAYRAAGMKVAVGLDDQSCTDISDPFQNLRIGLALIRTKYKDAKALSVRDMLFLHTLGSAEVLGIADKVGSLEVGKFADFLIVDPRNPDTGPLHDPVATYVLACGLRNLEQVYVGGRLIADGVRFPHQDEARLRSEIDVRLARLEAEARQLEKRTASVAPHPFAALLNP
ncbi:MAG: amidohydrolase family protein [Opitutaceae bacterium]|nr:amidohydrolase family protein [Opitutaceae bacterium]